MRKTIVPKLLQGWTSRTSSTTTQKYMKTMMAVITIRKR